VRALLHDMLAVAVAVAGAGAAPTRAAASLEPPRARLTQ
jgi:hypothetical protein